MIRNDLYWSLLDAFTLGDLDAVTQHIQGLTSVAVPPATNGAVAGFEMRFMDGLVHPFGAFSADLALSLWHLRGETDQIKSYVEDAENSEHENDLYTVQIAKFILGQRLSTELSSATDHLAPDLQDTFDNALETGTPIGDRFDDIFQRSAPNFLSYNGNILFDVITLLQRTRQKPAAFETVAASAMSFRQDILAGGYADLRADAKIGTLAFLLPIYPKLVPTASDAILPEATKQSLYDAAQELVLARRIG